MSCVVTANKRKAEFISKGGLEEPDVLLFKPFSLLHVSERNTILEELISNPHINFNNADFPIVHLSKSDVKHFPKKKKKINKIELGALDSIFDSKLKTQQIKASALGLDSRSERLKAILKNVFIQENIFYDNDTKEECHILSRYSKNKKKSEKNSDVTITLFISPISSNFSQTTENMITNYVYRFAIKVLSEQFTVNIETEIKNRM